MILLRFPLQNHTIRLLRQLQRDFHTPRTATYTLAHTLMVTALALLSIPRTDGVGRTRMSWFLQLCLLLAISRRGILEILPQVKVCRHLATLIRIR